MSRESQRRSIRTPSVSSVNPAGASACIAHSPKRKGRGSMSKAMSPLVATVLVLAWTLNAVAQPADAYLTEVVTIPSDGLKLRALLARPKGDGPFPVYI